MARRRRASKRKSSGSQYTIEIIAFAAVVLLGVVGVNIYNMNAGEAEEDATAAPVESPAPQAVTGGDAAEETPALPAPEETVTDDDIPAADEEEMIPPAEEEPLEIPAEVEPEEDATPEPAPAEATDEGDGDARHIPAPKPQRTHAAAGRYNRAPKPVNNLPDSIRKVVGKRPFRELEKTVQEQMKALGELSPTNPAHLHAAMLCELLRCTGADVMDTWAGQDRRRVKFLREFCEDSGWLELYLGCGLVPYRTDVGINILYNIWCAEKEKVRNKALAVALASLWGGGESTGVNTRLTSKNPAKYNPVWRYNFFVRQEQKGLLHPAYPTLRPWELRFTVGIAAQDWDDASFTWSAENINMPWDQYHNACWAATYTDPSRFGDSVQGGAYNMPYSSMSSAETTHRNGGVCGALSHLGAYAAMAHGIPAYTVGQPGHCAYAVRPKRGEWVGGFGGPDGGMHNHIFGDRAPESYLLMESVFGDDRGVALAYRASYCARALEQMERPDEAIAMWETALQHSPLHPFFRQALHRLMKEQGLTTDQCYAYLMQTIPHYTGNGFSAVNMCDDLEDQIRQMNAEQKISLYAALHRVVAGTRSSWATKCTDLIRKQVDTLEGEEATQAYLTEVFSIHLSEGDGTVFGQILEWAVERYAGAEDEEIFSQAFAAAARRSAPADGSKRNVAAAFEKAIIAAEKSRSASAFRSLTAAALEQGAERTRPIELNHTDDLDGTPAEAALIRLSTTSQWDRPACHADICTPRGGACHTDQEKKPHAIVELKESAVISGCIIRKTDGNHWRMRRATVAVSSDGATWHPIETTENMPAEWLVRFPAGTEGKWVRIEFDNEQAEFAHISHFVIYTH